MNADETAVREQVALAGRILAANGHSDYIWGHVAIRDPQGRGLWMKPSGLGFEEVTADDVLLVSFDGAVLAGSGRSHVEWPIHASVMLSRPDVGATVHSHPPHAIALGAADKPLLPVSHAATLFVPPQVPRYTRTPDLIVTRALGDEVAETLDDQSAMLLVNHGIVTAGPDVRSAVMRAVLLEDACRHQHLTEGFGGPAIWPGDDMALQKRASVWSERHLAQLWDYLVRRLDAGGEDRRART
jgi:L-fuculose-phosphate aldolase